MTGVLAGTCVVFVNHHSEALLAAKFEPLMKGGADVVVVDNSGTFVGPSGVTVVDSGTNVGFASGCNLALEHLSPTCSVVCFQNPDLDAPPDVIARLRTRLEQQARPGLVAPAIRVGRVVRRNGYRYPSPERELLLALRMAVSVRGAGVRAAAPLTRPPGPVSVSRDIVGRGRRFGSGGLLVACRAALTDVGGFDGDYFLYAEDLDLWHRVGQQGYCTEICPDVIVDHAEGTGGCMAGAQRELLRWLGVELFAERTMGRQWLAFRRAHRCVLPLVPAGALGDRVRDAWDRGARPEEVQWAVRAFLAGAVR